MSPQNAAGWRIDPAGIGPGSTRNQAGRDSSCGTAGTAAGDTAAVPGVFYSAEKRGLIRRAHRKLIHVGFTDKHRACFGKALHYRGVIRRNKVFQYFGPAGGEYSPGAENILVRNGDSGERAMLTPGELLVCRCGRGHGARFVYRDECIEIAVLIDSVETVTGQFGTADLAPAQQVAKGS